MRLLFEHDWCTWSFGISVTIAAPSRAFEFAVGLGPIVVGFAIVEIRPARRSIW